MPLLSSSLFAVQTACGARCAAVLRKCCHVGILLRAADIQVLHGGNAVLWFFGISFLLALPSLFLLVALQFLLQGKALPAAMADVGPFLHVDALVGDEVGALGETPAAFLAMVRPFARVRSAVLGEVRASDKGLPTVQTRVRLLPRVDALVADEGGAHAKALPAIGTAIGLLAPVYTRVQRKIGG